MPAVKSHSDGGRRDLLPDAVGSGLKGWLRRGNGVVLLILAALGWIGLLSWEMPLTGQAAGAGSAVSHLVGRLPAAMADFLLQSFGVAAALTYAIPTFWGIEQLARRRLGRWARRLSMWPTCVLATSGALSALPAPSNWPFARGLGGVVGDQLFALTRAIFAPAGASSASLAAGAALAITALVLFGVAIGFSGRSEVVSEPAKKESRGGSSSKAASADSSDGPRLDFGDDGPGPAGAQPRIDEDAADERWRSFDRTVRIAPSRHGLPPVFTRTRDEGPSREGGVDLESSEPMHVPYDDLPDDDESRRMAERFAPQGKRSALAAGTTDSEPPPWAGWKDLLGRANDRVALGPGEAAQALAPTSMPPAPELPALARATVEPDNARPKTWLEGAESYRVPSTNLLSRLPAHGEIPGAENRELVQQARRLEAALAEFGVRGQIVGAVPGPAVTQFEIETAIGTKTSRVVGLAEDIARVAGVRSARVVPVPGRTSLLIELPNERPDQVALRDLLESKAWRQSSHALPLPIGFAADRQPIVTDLATVTGVLVAGAASTGKSAALSAMIVSMLLRFPPSNLSMLLLDPRNSSLAAFEGIGHLVAPIAGDPGRARAALEWCLEEMDERLKAMSKLNLRGIGLYNNAVRNALRQGTGFKRSVQVGFDRVTGRAIYEEESVTPRAIPYLLVVMDDLDVLLQSCGPDIGTALYRLAQGASTAGIHLIAAASRLDGALLAKGAQAPFPARVCLKIGSRTESRRAIGIDGAELLSGNGDFLFSLGGTPVRGQAPALLDGDCTRVVAAIRRQVGLDHEPSFAGTRGFGPTWSSAEIGQAAPGLVLDQSSASLAALAGPLEVGQGEAGDLPDHMHMAGWLNDDGGPSDGQQVLPGRVASA